MANFKKQNVMSMRQFRALHGMCSLIQNPKKENSFFLATADGTVSAVGAGAQKFMVDHKDEPDLVLDTLQYHEFRSEDQDGNPILNEKGEEIWIPCIVRPADTNVVCSF